VVEGTGFENRRGATHQGFESLRFRKSLPMKIGGLFRMRRGITQRFDSNWTESTEWTESSERDDPREARGRRSRSQSLRFRAFPDYKFSMSDSPKPPSPLASPQPWNLVASGYDAYTRDFLANFSRAALKKVDLPPFARVVDVACGPGTTSLLLAEKVAHIDAIDFSPQMLSKFRDHLSGRNFSHVVLHEADGQDLPLVEAHYDMGVSMFGLMFFPDRVRGMKEFFRVLKPGGRVVIGSWAPAARSPLMAQMFSMLQVIDPSIPAPEADLTNHENPDVLRAELEEAGFVDVQIEVIEHAMHIEDIGEFWKAMEEGSVPIVMLKGRFSPEEWQVRVQAGLDHLKEKIHTPCQLSSFAHVGYGRKP
jgi:ubiquinone/menaquinone biosynthesis C-methylase UbiE